MSFRAILSVLGALMSARRVPVGHAACYTVCEGSLHFVPQACFMAVLAMSGASTSAVHTVHLAQCNTGL